MTRFNYYIGIDVSKLTLDISVLCGDESSAKTVYYKIENKEKNIAQFVKKTLGKYDLKQTLFCFEDTGIYSFPLSYYFSNNDLSYWKVPSLEIKRSRGIRRGKDDKIDSKDIAFYARTQLHKFRPSRLSPTAIQQLRLLFTEREKVLKSLALLERTSENKDFMPKEVFNVVAAINASVINKLKQAIESLEDKMLAIIASEEKLSQQYKLLTSIPGIGRQTAIYVLMATKGFEAFENWRQLACYAGVAPFPYQSGTSIRGRNKVHPLADKKLKSLLNMCALVAIRHDKELKTYYERKLEEGKPKMLVINNVRCKLLARVFAVINRNTLFVNTYKFAS
jgi:transposase